MRRLGWLLLLCASLAQADPSLQRLQQQLGQSELLRGQFEQQKDLQGFSHPLRSAGRFVMAAGRGVLWDTESPFPSQLSLSQRGLALDGEAQWEGGAAALRVNRLLLALISGDIEQLEQDFALQLQWQGERWQLQLRARDPRLGTMLQDLQLEGGQYVDTVSFVDGNGNRTRIVFSAQSAVPAELSAEEAARLD